MWQSAFFITRSLCFFLFDYKNRNALIEGYEDGDGFSELRRVQHHFHSLLSQLIPFYWPTMISDNKALFSAACGEGLTDEEILDCVVPAVLIHFTTGKLPLGKGDVCDKSQFLKTLFTQEKAFRQAQFNPGDIMKVFMALRKLNYTSRVRRMKSFLVENHSQLFDALVGKSPPQCHQSPNHVFCQLGAIDIL